jgi:hypothetical protein
MLFTLMLGVPVRSQGREVGTLKRIIVNNGVANQISVHPGLLGLERIVPISDVQEATPEQIVLEIADDEWKAYNAFEMKQQVVSDAAAPNLLPIAPRLDTTTETFDATTAEATASDSTLMPMAVVLSHSTRVGDEGRLAGLVIDTGIPQELIVEGGQRIPFTRVGVLDEVHIQLGAKPPRMDGATEPGALGDAPARMDNATPAGALGDRPPLADRGTDPSRPTRAD